MMFGIEPIFVYFLYECKLGLNIAKAAHNINQAFGENSVGLEKFRSSDFSVQKKSAEDVKCLGKPLQYCRNT